MGFWNDLKQLGKEIGEEISTLGSELKVIGKETAEEIKSNPAKYITDSVKEIAVGAAKVAVAGSKAIEKGMPEAIFAQAKKQDEEYQKGNLTQEQMAAYLEFRKKQAKTELSSLNRRIDADIVKEWDTDELSRQSVLIEHSCRRLKWYMNLSALDISQEDRAAMNEAIDNTRGKIRLIDEAKTKNKQDIFDK